MCSRAAVSYMAKEQPVAGCLCHHLPTGAGIYCVTKLLLLIVSLGSDLVLLNGGHEQRLPGTWPLTFQVFIHFAVYIHEGCLK